MDKWHDFKTYAFLYTQKIDNGRNKEDLNYSFHVLQKLTSIYFFGRKKVHCWVSQQI